jgi:diketogulonate reductase-like aldo/keto reductase
VLVAETSTRTPDLLTLVRKRPFGPTGIDVSVIGQGTWKLKDKAAAERSLRTGLGLGLGHIDTAELYRGSEEVVARAIACRRDDVFLVTKVRPPNTGYDDALRSAEGSLRRLQTDHVDVLLQHWWDDGRPVAETMRAFAKLLDEGKTRFVGVSNFTIEQMDEAQTALGRHKIVCNQVYYSMERRGIEHDLLPYCSKKGIAIVAYSPFGSGHFPSSRSRGGNVLGAVAAKHEVTPHQVVLNFLARHPSVFVIPKAETESHVRANAASLDFELHPEDVAELESAFPVGPRGELAMI